MKKVISFTKEEVQDMLIEDYRIYVGKLQAEDIYSLYESAWFTMSELHNYERKASQYDKNNGCV